MLQYGWVDEKTNMVEGIKFNPNKTDYYHFLSAQSIGDMFGYNEYDQILPLKDFMEAPVDVIEDLLNGVATGRRRAKEEAERAAKNKLGNKGKDPMSMIPKNLLKEFK